MSSDFTGSGGGGGGSRSPTRTANNLLSQDYVEMIFGLGHGPWKGLVPGNKGPLQSLFLGDTPVQNTSDGSANFADFRVAQFVGGDDDPDILRVLGGDSANLNVGVTLAQNVAVIRTTNPALRKTSTFPGLHRLEVRLVFNQLVKSNDDGTFEHTALFRIEYKPTNVATWSYFESQSTSSITGKTDGAVKDFLLPVTPLEDADYEVRVTKLSPDNGTQEIVNMGWESMQMVTLATPSYPGLAKLHIYGRVSEQFSSLPEISGIYEGFLIWVPSNYNPETRTYDESTPWNGQLVKRYSNNPAWVLYFLIKSTEYGLAKYYQNVSVILQEFYNAGKWCDEQVPSGIVGQTQPRFTFNELIDIQKSGIELLYYIAGSFNSVIYDSNNGIIRLKTDQPGVAKQLFTPETVVDGRFNYSFSDIATRYNDITVQFVNPDLNWELDERSANIDATEWIETNGRVPLTFVAVGCTNVHEAIRRANDRLITSNTEVTTVSFQTSRFGMLAELYDTIMVADPISGWSTGGRIKSYDPLTSTLHFRDPIYVASPQVFTIKIQSYSGISEVQLVPPGTPGLIYSAVIAGAGFDENDTPPKAQFTIESASNNFGFAKPFRVIAIAEVDGNVEQFQITAVEINPNKYADSASGTVSQPVQYDYVQPQEPKLPPTMLVENVPPLVLTGGSLGYRIRVSWERPRNAFTDHYEIDFSEVDSGAVKTHIAFQEEAYLEPVKDKTYYSIRLYAVSPKGKRSRYALENSSFLVSTKDVVLEDMSDDVGDFLLVQTPTGWRAGWSAPVAPVKDFAGVMLKYTYTIPRPPWSVLDTFGLSKPDETFKDLGWFEEGPLRIYAKFVNTSGNESGIPVFTDLTVLAPAAPTAVVTPVGPNNYVVVTDPTTTQPVKLIEVKLGEPGSNWDDASLDYFNLSGLTFVVPSRDGVTTSLHIRATDMAGNVGETSTLSLPAKTSESGINSSSATMYQWGTAVPEAPLGVTTYTWETGINDSYTESDGWTTTIPPNPGTPLAKLWVVSKPITAAFGVLTTEVSYSGLPRIAQTINGGQGQAGTSGLQGATPTVYRWAATTPAPPSGNPTYVWSTGLFGAAPDFWLLVPGSTPFPGLTLWAASVNLIEAAGIAATTFNWTNATIGARGIAGSTGAKGDKGTDGLTAKSLSLSASSQVFHINGLGVSNPNSITLTANSQNLVGSPTFIATGGTLVGSGSSRTLSFSDATSDTVTVQVSQDGLIDVMTVVKVRDGSDTYTVLLSNEVHTLPANATGGATSYVGAETYITVLRGGNDDTANWSITSADTNLTSIRSASSGGAFNPAGRFWRVSNQTADSGTIEFTLSKSGVATLFATMTSTLARKGAPGEDGIDGTDGVDGVDGLNAKSLALSASSQVFHINSVGVAVPNTITLLANSQNLSGAPVFTATGGTLFGSGNARTLAFADATSDTVTVQVSQDGLADLITLVKVRDGSDTYTVLLSNEAHTLPANATGGATSYAGAETYITVLRGGNDDTANWSITYSDTNLTSIRSATSGGAFNPAGRFWRVSNQTADIGTINFTLSKAGVTTLFATMTSTLARAGAKGDTGDTGPKGDMGNTGPKGDTGNSGGTGSQGNSYRTAYAVANGQSLSPSPANFFTYGAGALPPFNTWGGSETWGNTVPGYGAGQSIQQIDGIYNPATGETLWSSPYLSALKVGNLSVITLNTGNLSITGDMHMAGGAITSGSYTAAYAWPTDGGNGFHLSAQGLLFGNPSGGSGQYLQIEANGNIGSRQFSIFNGQAYFSGELQAASGHFRGAITGGSFGTGYAWPTDGGQGFHLSGSGLLIGNANLGRYFQVNSDGNIYAPGFSIINGNASFSGTITGGVFRTAVSGQRVEITGATRSLKIYDSSDTLRGHMGEYDAAAGYASIFGYGNSSGVAGSFYAARPNGYSLDVRNTGSRASGIAVYSDSTCIVLQSTDNRGAAVFSAPLVIADHISGVVLGTGGSGNGKLLIGDTSGAIGTVLSTKNIIITTNPATPTGGEEGDMVIVV